MIYNYIEEILNNRRDEILQFADILRQSGEFNASKSAIKAAKELINEEDKEEAKFLQKLCKFELNLISKEIFNRRLNYEV